MGDNSNQKTDADYEAAYQRFIDARKSKKKKIPGWIILASAIAIVLVVLVVLVKPWSAFDKKEGESVDIYATEPYTEQQIPEAADDQMPQAGMVAEPSGEGAVDAVGETAAETQAETSAEVQPEMQPEETTAPPSDNQGDAPATAAASQEPATQAPQETVASDIIADAGSQQGTSNAANGMIVTGKVAQDNAGILAPNEAEQIAAIVDTGEMAFAGYDFFVVTNNGNDGVGNTQYANDYYKKLVSNKKASGNGVVIFINGSDMTANILAFGSAGTKLGSSGKRLLTEEFVNTYKGSGNFYDAINTVYYLAQDLLLAGGEEETEENS